MSVSGNDLEWYSWICSIEAFRKAWNGRVAGGAKFFVQWLLEDFFNIDPRKKQKPSAAKGAVQAGDQKVSFLVFVILLHGA